MGNKIFDVVGWTLLFLMILGLRFIENITQNLINEKDFFVKFSLAGLALAVLAIIFLYKINSDYFKSSSEKRASAILGYFFGIIFLTLFTSALLNYYTAKANKQGFMTEVKKKTRNIRYHSYYLHLRTKEGKSEKFKTSKSMWDETEIGGSIPVHIGRGILGYEFLFWYESEFTNWNMEKPKKNKKSDL